MLLLTQICMNGDMLMGYIAQYNGKEVLLTPTMLDILKTANRIECAEHLDSIPYSKLLSCNCYEVTPLMAFDELHSYLHSFIVYLASAKEGIKRVQNVLNTKINTATYAMDKDLMNHYMKRLDGISNTELFKITMGISYAICKLDMKKAQKVAHEFNYLLQSDEFKSYLDEMTEQSYDAPLVSLVAKAYEYLSPSIIDIFKALPSLTLCDFQALSYNKLEDESIFLLDEILYSTSCKDNEKLARKLSEHSDAHLSYENILARIKNIQEIVR